MLLICLLGSNNREKDITVFKTKSNHNFYEMSPFHGNYRNLFSVKIFKQNAIQRKNKRQSVGKTLKYMYMYVLSLHSNNVDRRIIAKEFILLYWDVTEYGVEMLNLFKSFTRHFILFLFNENVQMSSDENWLISHERKHK